MRFGFPVRVLGRRGVRAYDTRRSPHQPHLSVSLAHLRDVFAYLATANIGMYRMSSDLVPHGLPPDPDSAMQQLAECAPELAAVGALAQQHRLRLSFHAPLYVQLGADEEHIAQRASAELQLLAAVLDGMAQDADAVIVVHVGGTYGMIDQSLGRWIERFDALPTTVQRRLVLEHEDHGASLGAALRIHAATGVPLVFDYLHFCLNNPERWSLAEGLAVALATWPYDRTPKIHFSSPRTELQVIEQRHARRGQRRWIMRPPRPGHHADFLNVWEFARVLEAAGQARDFDVMLEAKAGDVALRRLRRDLARYMPELAAVVQAERVIEAGT